DQLHRVGAAHLLLHGRRAPGDLDPLRLHEGGAARRPPDRRPLARRGGRTPRRRRVRSGAAVGPPPAPGLNQHGGSERPQAPGWLGTPRRSRGAPREPGLRAPPSPRVARDAPAEPWRPSRTRQALRSVARAEAPDSPVLHRRDRALPGERVEDEIGEPGTALLADEHSRPSELGEAVAAAEQIARDRDRVGAVGRERLACYLDAHEAAAG